MRRLLIRLTAHSSGGSSDFSAQQNQYWHYSVYCCESVTLTQWHSLTGRVESSRSQCCKAKQGQGSNGASFVCSPLKSLPHMRKSWSQSTKLTKQSTYPPNECFATTSRRFRALDSPRNDFYRSLDTHTPEQAVFHVWQTACWDALTDWPDYSSFLCYFVLSSQN